jgi:phenylpropionate dioxygenase-like ring-hydroxylating dioxygenase large terminal subunit
MDLSNLELYVDDRPQEQIFRVHPAVYTDPELFELEMKHIFEKTWIFLTLESEIAKPNDFITTRIARTPVIVTRKPDGNIGAFINACRHKGATIARVERGNARYHVCPYHGWAYDASGRNVDIKDRKSGCYAPAFDADNHDLLPIARVQSYKGMVFGSLSADVPSLEDFFGDARYFIDMWMEQGPKGMEIIPGRCNYVYRGNWKFQMENGQDAYHFSSTHASFAEVQRRRMSGTGNTQARTYDWKKRANQESGTYDFPNGHTTVWINLAEVEKRPIFPVLSEIESRVGKDKAQWMLKQRNVVCFPNLQMADQITPFLRLIRPISVDRTELCNLLLAPVGEAPELRAWRIRQFEDFINPGGLATPDDVAVFGEMQMGLATPEMPWLQGYERGMSALHEGRDETSKALGIKPEHNLKGLLEMQNEVGLHAPFREWARLMKAGAEGRKAFDR